MAEPSTLKLIFKKGPKEGETITYPSTTVVKIGRVARGNTIAIKDDLGISSKHISIQFDTYLNTWTLCDLDSSNGTLLNGQILKPRLLSGLEDGDCIKIGELTSFVVRFDVEPDTDVRPKRKGGRVRKCVAESVEIGGSGVEGLVEKRNLRSCRGRKTVELKSEVESLGCGRILRSLVKKDVTENSNVDLTDVSVAVEGRPTRGRKKKIPVGVNEDHDYDQRKAENIVVVPINGKRTRGRRKRLDENLDNGNESSKLDEGKEVTFDKVLKDSVENVKDGTLMEDVNANDESAQEHVGNESLLKDTGVDNVQWDLDKMTLSDFFCYMEVQLAKEIYDGSEKIISGLKEKARRCHEFRCHKNENGNGN